MLIKIMPTGVLYKDTKEIKNCVRYNYEVKVGKNLIYQETKEELKKLKPRSGWYRTNEPEEHLDSVTNKIVELVEPKRILCFSYKDKSLAERIQKKCKCEIQTIYDIEASITMKYAEDSIDTVNEIKTMVDNEGYDLIIWRHYMEHFENYDEILRKLCEKANKGATIYIEVPDCEKFIKKGIPIFL